MKERQLKARRQHNREKIRENCILRLMCKNAETDKAIFVETLDYSKGGLGIIYSGEELCGGNEFSVHIEDLNTSKKLASVVWSEHLNGDYIAGLKWV